MEHVAGKSKENDMAAITTFCHQIESRRRTLIHLEEEYAMNWAPFKRNDVIAFSTVNGGTVYGVVRGVALKTGKYKTVYGDDFEYNLLAFTKKMTPQSNYHSFHPYVTTHKLIGKIGTYNLDVIRDAVFIPEPKK